uniref:Zinc finger protein 689 n=1 Tax=Pan troglodytes TaxID=9598 RepID=G2HJV8_PANTR|nr:zinc finger protein 689 [Pan troglodytes]
MPASTVRPASPSAARCSSTSSCTPERSPTPAQIVGVPSGGAAPWPSIAARTQRSSCTPATTVVAALPTPHCWPATGACTRASGPMPATFAPSVLLSGATWPSTSCCTRGRSLSPASSVAGASARGGLWLSTSVAPRPQTVALDLLSGAPVRGATPIRRGRTAYVHFILWRVPEKGRRSPRSYRAESELNPGLLLHRAELCILQCAGCLPVRVWNSPIRRGDIIWLKFSKLPYPKIVCVDIRAKSSPHLF